MGRHEGRRGQRKGPLQRSQGPQLGGFTVGGESSHREHIKQELLTEIAWNPMTVDLDDCHETVDNWTLRPESSGTPSARNQGGYGYAILMLQHGHD
ncbi:TPA: hypothetical protein EYO57_15240 [Candidatus Poribacteria bacterium]|nr:hypothetical protein [Candidatus Poribacteria bacterium]